jgi:hypothetical protein
MRVIKIDLYVIDGTLRGQKYRDQILRSLVVPYFDGHPLASRPILMDVNARSHNPHSARLSATEGNRATTHVSSGWKMESNQFSTLLLMIKSITSITASHPVQFLKTSPNSVNQASQSVLRVLLPSLKQSSP